MKINSIQTYSAKNISKNDFGINELANTPKTTNQIKFLSAYPKAYAPIFKGLWFENNIVKQVEGKEYQGKGIYKEGSDFLDFNKVGWDKLSQEPLDITKASNKEIYAFYHANALAETNDSTWVRRFNHYNVTKPLAVFHTLGSRKSKEVFEAHLRELHNPNMHHSLDIPIVDENGKLNIDCTVFDTETTGINISDTSKPLDKIIQIGAIQVKKGDVDDSTAFNQLINPEIHIPEKSTDVHGITDEMVQDKPTMEKVLKPFINNYLTKKNGVIVAYNSKFDMTLLNNAIREHNSYSSDPLKERKTCKVLDPFILIQRIHPYLGARKKLGEQYKFLFCKNMDNAHDAFADVKGTVDVLKYSLYYLNEHRIDKSKPLTLREVLVFQNGGKVENLDIPLDNEGCNANVNFRKSYSQVSLAVDNYFKGYKLTAKDIKELTPIIGQENAQKLEKRDIKNKLYDLKSSDGHTINPAETNQLPKQGGVENAFYVMRNNFKKVLAFAKIEGYKDLTQEEVTYIITQQAKKYVHEDSVDVWMKNPNPKDIPDGNDLPDIEIAKKVMQEEKNNHKQHVRQ